MYTDAIISENGLYRYTLERVWDHERPVLGWIMLNPSTADEKYGDPTVRSCITLAQRWNYGGISIRNLFAYRAPKPTQMMQSCDPVGPEDDKYILQLLSRYDTVVLAWGGKGGFLDRDKQVLNLIKASGHNLASIKCLGTNNNGSPVHPLGTIGHVQILPFPWETVSK